MKRLLCALLLLAGAGPARAHFVWIVPGKIEADRPTASVVFSDNLKPDEARLLKKIAHTTFRVRDLGGKVRTVKATERKDVLHLALPGKGPQAVLAVCPYGVVARGKAEPFLLEYCAKSFAGVTPKTPEKFLTKPWKQAPLEVVPVLAGPRWTGVRVLWQGKPLAGAEVVVLSPGAVKGPEGKTDKDGAFTLSADKPGIYGIRARHVVAKEGTQGDKKYKAVRYYATLTLERSGKAKGKPAENPAASKLLADARAARAHWAHFPGFTADLEVNVDGKAQRGTVSVSAKGAVTVNLEGDAKGWVRRTLEQTAGHRLDNTAKLKTPCAFPDEVTDHPLGRSIRVLDDEFHSSYRIRDRQIIVVNRQTGPVRFSITVLANKLNEEKKYLPTCYTVNTWDRKSKALKSSVTHYETWQRVGKFDLPHTILTVAARAGGLEARSLKLSKYRLLK
jgi:uncharacterized GH25 family protein